MAVSGNVPYLPMLNPVRVPLRGFAPNRHRRQVAHQRPHRVYRLPPRKRQEGLYYGLDADMRPDHITGRIIDIYA